MLRERSYGAILFRQVGDHRLYLLLDRDGKQWDFSKGHGEEGETELSAMKRELAEETGISDPLVAQNFHEKITYFFRQAGELVLKEVVFFLCKTTQEDVHLSREHVGYRWASYDEALHVLSFDNAKDVLRKAEALLASGNVVFQCQLTEPT